MRDYQIEYMKKMLSEAEEDDIPDWNTYFMNLALVASTRSKDPNTKVGACIVDKYNKILGLGYNGLPKGVSDNEFPWNRDNENPLDNKYIYVVHAEANAILNSNNDLKGGTIYVTLSPCNECAKLIIQAGIKKVIYLKEYNDNISSIATSRMFKTTGVEMLSLDEVINK